MARSFINQWLPRTLIILGVLLLLQSCLGVTGIGRIYAGGKTYNAGVVKSGDTINQKIPIANYTLQSVDIEPLPSCGCTIMDAATVHVHPFVTTNLTARIDTSGMPSGVHEKAVSLHMHAGQKSWEEVVTCRFEVH